MVSAQIKGVVRFYRKTPEGNRVLLFEGDIQQLGPGGSSDGAIANTPEKWVYIPAQRRADKVMNPNDHLVVTFEAAAAATSDASDGAVVLPLTLNGGSPLQLGKFDASNYWDVKQFGDVALLANYETVLAERTVREVCVLGNDTQRAFISIENNA
jgi:hypothetical protein